MVGASVIKWTSYGVQSEEFADDSSVSLDKKFVGGRWSNNDELVEE